MEFSRIFVLGAGAIGSVYGAFLSRNNKVILVGRKPHIKAIHNYGLKLTGDLNQEFNLESSIRIDEIPSNSLILLTTKANDLTRAINDVKAKLRNDSQLLVLQNGLGNEKIVKAMVGTGINVLRGITMIASEFIEPGKIRFWKGMTIIEKNRVSEDIKRLFNECGLETNISDNIGNQVWDKLVLNCILGPLTAILRVRNNKVGSEKLLWVRNQILMECTKIGKAEGIDLQTNLKEIDLKINKYANFSSMYQDMSRGKKTEIDFLNGMIVKLGKKHHIPTPINRTLKCLIEFMEDKPH